MYVDTNLLDNTVFYQGDVIKDFPFYNLKFGQPVEKNQAGHFEAMDAEEKVDYLTVVETAVTNVMILSQTCDIQHRDNVLICPVLDLEKYSAEKAINQKRVEALRGRTINYWFYLPAHGVFKESFADLQLIQFVPRDNIKNYLGNRILCLSDLGRHHLSWSLTTYFGRPALPDAQH